MQVAIMDFINRPAYYLGKLNLGNVFILNGKRTVAVLSEPDSAFNQRVEEKEFWREFDQMTAESSHENDLLNNGAFSRNESSRNLPAFLDERLTP